MHDRVRIVVIFTLSCSDSPSLFNIIICYSLSNMLTYHKLKEKGHLSCNNDSQQMLSYYVCTCL